MYRKQPSMLLARNSKGAETAVAATPASRSLSEDHSMNTDKNIRYLAGVSGFFVRELSVAKFRKLIFQKTHVQKKN